MKSLISTSAFLLFSAVLFNPIAHAQTKVIEKTKETALFFNGVDAKGKRINLKQYAGKTVLVSFYSASCSLCARDLKLMRDFYRDNMHKNFVLIAMSLENSKQEFDHYMKLISLTIPKNQQFPIIWRNNPQHQDNFGTIKTDPTHFLINAEGQLILKREGTFQADDWDNLWESLDS